MPERAAPAYRTRPADPVARDTIPAEVLAAMKARQRRIEQRAAASAVVAEAAGRTTPRVVSRILRNPRSLRRAVAVAAVLAPCKALEDEQ